MKKHIITMIICSTALPTIALAGVEKEEEPHFDTYFYVDNGRIRTGAILEEDAGVPGAPDPFIPNVRVFGAEMGEEFPNFADEPGFDSELSLFPSGTTSLKFNVIGALQEWNGTEFVATSSTMDIDYLANTTVSTPAGPSDIVPGFSTDFLANDTFHLHYDYTLQNPATGIFLLSLNMEAPGSGLTPSVPFFYVFNNGLVEEDHEAAIEYAETFLPAPGAAMLFALPAGIAMRRKRNA